MVSLLSNLLSGSQGSQLIALQQTARSIDQTQSRLASGLRVNSPLDNPSNFFTSTSLSQEASNLNRVLDRIGQSVRTIQVADNALSAQQDIITRAGDVAREGRQAIENGRDDIGNLILADNPVIYYRLNETSGTTVTNIGSAGATLNGTFQAGVTLNSGALSFSENATSVRFDGTNDRIAIPNNALVNTSGAGYPERTVELTFQADNLNGRQVLFEEGGTGNSAGIYLDDDRIYYVARDAGDFGPFDISAEVEAGRTYQAAFVLDSNNGTFTGYLNGDVVGVGAVTKPLNAHGGAVAIGRNAGGTFFHDGANGGNGEYFEGRIADFALYNSVVSQENLQARYNAAQIETGENYQQQITDILSQLDPLSEDASFQGINLLQGDNLTSYFDDDSNSNLLTEGQNFNLTGFGLDNVEFSTLGELDNVINTIDSASDQFQTFQSGLSADLNIIESRQGFTEKTINTLQAGSGDLTLADQEEEAANLLALQTRQEIQVATLALSARGSNIANLLAVRPIGSN